jgi:4-hydroxyphenylpyruvate dioxygenase-like putative hemolysin
MSCLHAQIIPKGAYKNGMLKLVFHSTTLGWLQIVQIVIDIPNPQPLILLMANFHYFSKKIKGKIYFEALERKIPKENDDFC